ncbi:trehalase family glycosidase, partial [Pseudomonas aeruginosa]|uniref:trehalase family glycosidase n=1 Tax=Pseudomonas aeruginosa TaxID=287 RepID=UPI00106A87F7
MPDRTALPRAMLAAWVLLLLAACSQGPAPTPPASSSWGWQDASGERAIAPDEAYPELFQAVQESRLFSDQKHFVDALPLREPARIRADYLRERERPGFDLRAFVGRNFEESGSVETAPPEAGADLASHISDLWPALTRHYEQVPAHSSLLPLPKPYVVPGGRFREVYYWDSYFTMLGLAESRQHQRVRDMLDNFAYLIDTYGHIPNGNRSYYLSRSQPPFFAYMVDLQARREGDAAYRRYLPQLQKEYAYWMEGSAGLRPNEARLHVVKLADGSLLNRYWDNRDTPRQESFLEDRATAARAPQRPAGEVYRDLRAGAESGWDFSSRWLDDGRELASIRTTAIVPVDLNALLYHLERTIAKACASSALKACEQGYGARAEKRRQAIEDHLWHPAGYYADYDWQRRRPIERINAASIFP